MFHSHTRIQNTYSRLGTAHLATFINRQYYSDVDSARKWQNYAIQNKGILKDIYQSTGFYDAYKRDS
jgi:hypothetical protein